MAFPVRPIDKPPIAALLGLGHLLFLSGLFWSDGIHTATLHTFVGAPLLELPYPTKSLAQTIIYALGLLTSLSIYWSFCSAHRTRSRATLISILLMESYFIALDLRLADRYWVCLAIGTFVFACCGERWARLTFWLWPASGPSGFLTLLTLPLLPKRSPPLLVLLLSLLWYQSHQLASMKGLVLSVGLAWLLFGTDREEFEGSKFILVGCAVSILMISILWSHNPSPLRVTLEFEHEYKLHQVDILRRDGDVEIFVDRKRMLGPWYIDGDLLLNPYLFRSAPERLDSQALFESYGRELAKRHGVRNFRVELRPWSRDGLGRERTEL